MNGIDDNIGLDAVIHGSASTRGSNGYASKLESVNLKILQMGDLLFMLKDDLCIP